MISLFWAFVGFLVGLLITAVFAPPMREVLQVPTPDLKNSLHTKTGCVKFTTTEVPCDNPVSLNFVAQHK
jgi:hypothetical protein